MESAVTAADVFKTLQRNADISRRVAAAVLDDLASAALDGTVDSVLDEEKGCMRHAIMPRSTPLDEGDRKKLAYILPEYFDEENRKEN